MMKKTTFRESFHDAARRRLEIRYYRTDRSFFSDSFVDFGEIMATIWRSLPSPGISNQPYLLWDKVLYSSRGIRIRCYTVPTASRIKKVLKLIVTGHLFRPYGPNKGG